MTEDRVESWLELQGLLFAKVRDALPLVLQPPPIRGLSQTGGFELMVEDRAGKGVEALHWAVFHSFWSQPWRVIGGCPEVRGI